MSDDTGGRASGRRRWRRGISNRSQIVWTASITIIETRSAPLRSARTTRRRRFSGIVRNIGIAEQNIAGFRHNPSRLRHALRHGAHLAGPAGRNGNAIHHREPRALRAGRVTRRRRGPVAATVVDHDNTGRAADSPAPAESGSSRRSPPPRRAPEPRQRFQASRIAVRRNRRRDAGPHARIRLAARSGKASRQTPGRPERKRPIPSFRRGTRTLCPPAARYPAGSWAACRHSTARGDPRRRAGYTSHTAPVAAAPSGSAPTGAVRRSRRTRRRPALSGRARTTCRPWRLRPAAAIRRRQGRGHASPWPFRGSHSLSSPDRCWPAPWCRNRHKRSSPPARPDAAWNRRRRASSCWSSPWTRIASPSKSCETVPIRAPARISRSKPGWKGQKFSTREITRSAPVDDTVLVIDHVPSRRLRPVEDLVRPTRYLTHGHIVEHLADYQVPVLLESVDLRLGQHCPHSWLCCVRGPCIWHGATPVSRPRAALPDRREPIGWVAMRRGRSDVV